MTPEQITEHVRNLDALERRYDDAMAAFHRCPLSPDVHRLLNDLARDFNRVLAKLKQAGISAPYQTKPWSETRKTQSLGPLQTVFVESGIDLRDLLRKDKPKPTSALPDGLGGFVGW